MARVRGVTGEGRWRREWSFCLVCPLLLFACSDGSCLPYWELCNERPRPRGQELRQASGHQLTEALGPVSWEERDPAHNRLCERWSRWSVSWAFRWDPGPSWHFDYSLMGDLELRIQLVKVKVLSCSVVSNFVTPWTVACQAKILEWAAILFSRGSSLPRDRTWVSCLLHCRFFTVWATREAQLSCTQIPELHNLWDNKYVLF